MTKRARFGVSTGMARLLAGCAAVSLPLAFGWQAARADTPPSPPPIALELNKLEPLPAPGGCRVYMVVNNADAEPIGQLRLDLMLFGSDGVIARRIALDLAPLTAHKTAVRLFDVPGEPCDQIGRVLVSDVLACEIGKHEPPAEQPAQICLDRLQLSSRGKVELVK